MKVLREQIRKLDVACAVTGRYTQFGSAGVSAVELALAVFRVAVFHGAAPVFEGTVAAIAAGIAIASYLRHQQFSSRRTELKQVYATQVQYALNSLAATQRVAPDTIQSLTKELTS